MIKKEKSFKDLVMRGYGESKKENNQVNEALCKVAFF